MAREYKMYINGEWVDAITAVFMRLTLTRARSSHAYRQANAPTPAER